MEELIKKANEIYLKNFPNETCFERALFFSWSCSIRDCTFCYMSTQKNDNSSDEKKSLRSKESIYAETLLCKKLGWDIGFVSGGILSYTFKDLNDLLKNISEIYGDRVWLNAGPIPEFFLKEYSNYIKGVVGSIETVNPELHKKVCPSKPTKPYEFMFNNALKLGLKTSMTLIIGLGETKDDFKYLKKFIEDYKISKIHIYTLNPVKGTEFEGKNSPTKEEVAWWVANTRIEFPEIDIQVGIWKDKTDYVSYLINAGANSVSKFPVIRSFASEEAFEFESQIKDTGRKLNSYLTIIPEIDWDNEINKLNFDLETKEKIKIKLTQYLETMNKKKELISFSS